VDNGGRASRPRIDTQSPETIESASHSVCAPRAIGFFLLLKKGKEEMSQTRQANANAKNAYFGCADPLPLPTLF
jgi:hypothetical protein